MTAADVPALVELYGRQSEVAFSADLFAESLFFGIREGDRIVSAAGTHALSRAHSLAVVGHVLTAPEARGRAYATAVTAAVVTALFEQHFTTVVLNVFEDNHTAVGVYRRLGFATRHHLVTGGAVRVE